MTPGIELKIDTGARRAAMLLALLPDEAGAKVLSHLDETEVEKIGVAMGSLGLPPADEVRETMLNYLESGPAAAAVSGGRDRFDRWLDGARRPDTRRLRERVDRALGLKDDDDALDVSATDPATLAGLLEAETPQAIVLVLSRLEPKLAAAIIGRLRPATRTQVASRLARLEAVDPKTADEVLRSLKLRVDGLGSAVGSDVAHDGIRSLASILEFLGAEGSAEVMQAIEEKDAALAEEIRTRSMAFEDVRYIGDRDMATLIQRIDKKVLPMALKGTVEEIQSKFFRGMSTRAADMIREEMQLLGPVRLAEVEKAQATVVLTLRQLVEEGVLAVDKGGEGYVA